MISGDRDKIYRAFHEYSRLGLASGRLDAFETCDRIRGVCAGNKSKAYDLLAVYDCLRLLEATGNADVLEAVHKVYFSLKKTPGSCKKNEISMRVLRHATESCCDERTVYRRLKTARMLYAKLRK